MKNCLLGTELTELSQEIELETMKTRIKELEAQLRVVSDELGEKTRLCLALSAAIKRRVSRRCDDKENTHPGIPVIGQIADPERDDEMNYSANLIENGPGKGLSAWVTLRVGYLGLLDENGRLKRHINETETTLRTEREWRLRDIEKVKCSVSQVRS